MTMLDSQAAGYRAMIPVDTQLQKAAGRPQGEKLRNEEGRVMGQESVTGGLGD